MANTAQARKRARQAEKHRRHNMAQRSSMRTFVKNVVKAIASGDKTIASEAYKRAVPMLDTMVTKGQIQINKAARHKSRLNAQIKAMA